MALDYGRRRIGIATTDPLRTIASPHSACRNEDPAFEPPPALLRLIEELDPARVLVGIPTHMDGSAGEMASEAKKFASRLRELTGREVTERDERLTTYEAEEMMRGMELSRRRKREKGLKDMLAATVMLREYLEEVG